jgi:predicted nucleotide-binding protein
MTGGVITKVAQVNICILQISNLVKDYLPFDLTSVTYVYFHPDSNNINSIQFF